MVFHLNCPVTSDIVEGDGLGNAEANKENIRLEIEILSVGISGNSLWKWTRSVWAEHDASQTTSE